MAPGKRKAALVRDAAAEVVAAAFKGKGFPQAELHKVFASHSSRNEDGVWVVNEALLSGRQGAAWRTLKAHLATLEQDKAIIALHNVASSMTSPAPSTVPAASSTASPAPPKTPAASSDGLAASKDDTKPKSALRMTQKTLNMDSDAPVKSAAPTPPSFKSPGPAVAPMAAATHQVNWTPPPDADAHASVDAAASPGGEIKRARRRAAGPLAALPEHGVK
ncbi:hypothetical protein SPRG_08310 [Saprolegnia parasitica CBS 223.65]|uniref:Uncharacterized protein n=1 Tax=Saprolegnia parasitica (strain CBS 223.65) TaxID=695850 RepID=A0A067CAQ9_SAPPC|nr:hypothetical protein SPRG_08310 [Saprolegnia parasitica CBS 223.65]KDO26235.1 hypothetical protein SPRG_08310 [Saprolegnia parasitica CBS 223.65]|eukprot:XP_012202944.1 hypothetical protein SPRG_08310 [Saprolegnia parasitica CBS 223.65]